MVLDRAINAEGEENWMRKYSENEVPAKIKTLRAKLGLTQEQFAARLGVSWSTVNRWENGRSRPSPLAMRYVERLRDMANGGARS